MVIGSRTATNFEPCMYIMYMYVSRNLWGLKDAVLEYMKSLLMGEVWGTRKGKVLVFGRGRLQRFL